MSALADAFNKGSAPLAVAPPIPAAALAASSSSRGTGGEARKRARPGSVPGAAAGAAPRRAPETAERLARTVFVGNVPTSTSAASLARLVQQAVSAGPTASDGELAAPAPGGARLTADIESVRFRSVPVAPVAVAPGADYRAMARAAFIAKSFQTGSRDAMNAYVVCSSARAAAAALKLNGSDLGGHTLRVDRAARGSSGDGDGATGSAPAKAAPLYEPKRTVFIGHLHYDASEEELRAAVAARVTGGADSVEAVRIVRDAATSRGKGIAYVLLRERSHVAEALGLHGSSLRGRALRVERCLDERKAPAAPSFAAAARMRVDKQQRLQGGRKVAAATAAAGGSVPLAQAAAPASGSSVPPLHKRPRVDALPAVPRAPRASVASAPKFAAARPAHMGARGAEFVQEKVAHKADAERRKGVKARRNREDRHARRASERAAKGGVGGVGAGGGSAPGGILERTQ